MDRIITINLDEFLEFVEQKDGDYDDTYHAEFVKDVIREYFEKTPCPECGSKIKETKKVWSETKCWVLEYNTICQKCGYIIEMKDNRDNIKKDYLDGYVKVKDVEIIKKELGLE